MSGTGIKKLFEAYKRRRVFRVTAIYVIAFWPLIQLIDILSSALAIPDYFMRYLVFGFFGGLPFVLMFAWLYDLRKSNIDVEDGQPELALLGSKTEFAFIAALIVLVSALFFVQLSMDDSEETQPSVVSEGDTAPPITKSDLLAKKFDSIAVLPFVSFSAEPRDQFFADGLTEELLNVLSRLPDLKVAARTSSFAYKGVNKNVQIIGTELGVSTILEGSVRKNDVDDTVRITAQLVDVSNGAHLWSKTFDRKFEDVFKIQDQISHAVGNHLQLTLSGNVEIRPRNNSANPNALIAFSMGQAALSKRTEQGLKDAEKYFQEAVNEDPKYALAYTGLADANTLQVNYGYVADEVGLPKAEAAVNVALKLDPDLGIAWASRGLILSQQDKKTEAEKALLNAIELNPSYAMAYMWFAGIQADDNDKLTYYRQAFSLDPKSAVAGYNIANILVKRGRDVEAMEVFSQIVNAQPFYANAYTLVARMSNRRGQIAEAIREYRRSYDLNNDVSMAVQIASLYIDIGDFSNADKWLALGEAGVPEEFSGRFILLKVRRYAAQGDEVQSQAYLKKLVDLKVKHPSDYYIKAFAAYYNYDFESAIKFYEQGQTQFTKTGSDEFVMDIEPAVKIAIAHAYKSLGRKEDFRLIMSGVEQGLNDKLARDEEDSGENWFRKVQIAALNNDELNVRQFMQKSIDQGWRDFWLPSFDPIMANFRADTAVQSMLAGLETRMNIIREQSEVEAQFASRWND